MNRQGKPAARRPNHDATGRPLAGRPVESDATTGDKIVINGLTWDVADTWPNGVRLTRPGSQERTHTYRELRQAGAFYAAL